MLVMTVKEIYDLICILEFMRNIKQPIYSITQRISEQEDRTNSSSKYNIFDPLASPSMKHLRSLSKNKKKLRYHLFKNKNLVTQDHFYSPGRHEQPRGYSSYVQLMQSPLKETKTSFKVSIDEQPLLKKLTKKQPEPQSTPSIPDKKQKKQFKLIHQIKREKAKKNQQKIIAEQQRSNIYHEKIGHIEGMGAKKIEIFAQELHDILHDKAVQVQKSSVKQQSIVLSNVIKDNMEKVPSERPNYQTVQQNLAYEVQIQKIPKNIVIQSYKMPDLNRSSIKAQQLLKNRKNSNSSIDFSMRTSKLRLQMSLSLALQSRNHSKANISDIYEQLLEINKSQRATTIDKILFHISILQTMSEFVYEATKFDGFKDEWQQVNFLIYKKYYIERIKIVNFINKYPMKNPFLIYNAQISSKEIIQFMKKPQGKEFKQKTLSETNEIKNKLQKFYSHFDKGKVGEKINLFEYDNFSYWIIEQLWAELIFTQYNTSHDKEAIDYRMCRILQVMFLISQLNGKYQYPFQQSQLAIKNKRYQSFIQEGKQIFQKYILQQSR